MKDILSRIDIVSFNKELLKGDKGSLGTGQKYICTTNHFSFVGPFIFRERKLNISGYCNRVNKL